MGLVRCSRHGDQIGPLTCDHIHSEHHAIPDEIEAFVQFQIDLVDDGSVLLDAALCANCAKTVPVSSGETVSGRRSEERDFPYVAPICGLCFAELRRSHG
jgi:hypothetical protein